MPIFKDCEMFYSWLNPEWPNKKYNKINPTWETQIRTRDVDQKKEWQDGGLVVKGIIPDDEEPYFRVNLKKNSKKATDEPLLDEEGNQKIDEKTKKPMFVLEPAPPVEVYDAEMNELDPSVIGNGSIGNIKVYQYDYTSPDGTPKKGSVLMAVQITKLVKYIRKKKEEAELESTGQKTIVIEPEEEKEIVPPSEY